VVPGVNNLEEEEFLHELGRPELSAVTRKDGKPLGPNMPTFLVEPTSFPNFLYPLPSQVKIIDFGESFFSGDVPDTLHTPLPVRPPEVIFGDKLDYRVDLWTAGCLVSEIATREGARSSYQWR